MVPMLPESFWEFHDSFVPSETAGPLVFWTNVTNETYSVKRLPGSRTIRGLAIMSGRRSFQRLHRTSRRLRQKRRAADEQESQIEEEMMESDLMDAEGSLHQRPRDVCDTEAVMNDEGSLHQTNEVCTVEDAEPIDLGWFENTKLNRVKNGTRCLLQVGLCDWESLGTSPSRIQKWFGEAVAEGMDAEVEGEDAIHPSKRPQVGERVATHVPPEVELQNLDCDVNEVLRSSPNPVVASVFRGL